jgi:flagellar hook-length control protein FliK
MSFGFLARARMVEPAATTASDAKADNDERPATTADADPQGFAATAADSGGSDEMPPDPSAFAKSNTNEVAVSSGPDAVEVAAAAPAAMAPVAAEPASASPPAAVSAAAPAAEAASPVMTNTLLVVGLPMGAVVLLVGVFWVILRGGAV